MPTKTKLLKTIRGLPVLQIIGSGVIFYKAGMTIDADGSPRCYHATNDKLGLDSILNAGPDSFEHGPNGKGVVQTAAAGDPAPGFLISTTSLRDPARQRTARYVDSEKISFLVLPGGLPGGAKLGDLGTVINLANKKRSHAIFADSGPPAHLGEGSIALATRLGIDVNARHGGTDSGVVYLIYPGSGDKLPKTPTQIDTLAQPLFAQLNIDELIHILG